MKAQEIILSLAECITQGLDPKTASVFCQALKGHRKAIQFLMDYRHTLLFYKRHCHDEKLGWLVEYIDKRIPGPLRKIVEDLSDKGSLSIVRKDRSTS